MNQKYRPFQGNGVKPDVPPEYDDTADPSKYLYNRGHAPVPHNKNDHRHLDLDPHEMTYWEQRISGLTRLLVEKGIITLDEMRRSIEEDQARNIALGGRVVARAWVDPAFKKRLLEDGTEACKEFGVQMDDCKLVAYEQTDDVHWVVVCTLCSCYPRPLLGQPPHWYKSTAYRNRVVVDPRGLLTEEFGTVVSEDAEVRVIDSTADTRFLIIPKRPAGTEGWSEDDLAELVTCESVVGVAPAKTPEQVRREKNEAGARTPSAH
ncbi:MAG: nitrile hydratase subunit alpha [Nitrospinota bacterium]